MRIRKVVGLYTGKETNMGQQHKRSSRARYRENHPNTKHTPMPGPGLRERIRSGEITTKEALDSLPSDASPTIVSWLNRHKGVDWAKRRAKKEKEKRKENKEKS